MNAREKILTYARKHGVKQDTVARWLELSTPDQTALLELGEALNLGENHFRDFLDWLIEISLRDGATIVSLVTGEMIAPTLSDLRLSRNDKLKHIKQAVRRYRFPRLSRLEDEMRKRIRKLKTDPRITITVPQALEGGVRVELCVTSAESLARLGREIELLAQSEAAKAVFEILSGKEEDADV